MTQSGHNFNMENEHYVILLPELIQIAGWNYSKAYGWLQALRVHEGWRPFQKINVDTAGRPYSTVTVSLPLFIEICRRLPELIPTSAGSVLPELKDIIMFLGADPSVLDNF